jgi:hypothetical protein
MLLARLTVILLFFNAAYSHSQVKQVINALETDSSYYDIYKLSETETWLCGEHGVLKRMEQSGNVTPVAFPNTGANLLKILRIANYVFIAADKGTLYRYNLTDGSWKAKQFPEFKNRCFYDLCEGANGSILVCGGASRIARGKMDIPYGFIAWLDSGLTEVPLIRWSSIRKFPWTLLKKSDGSILAAVFNGISTQIYTAKTSTDYFDWEATDRIPGLVHSLNQFDGTVYYSGCQTIRYTKHGTWGSIGDHLVHHTVSKSGLICNLVSIENKIYGFTQKGLLLQLLPDKINPIYYSTEGIAFYEGLISPSNKLILVGHGEEIRVINLAEY